jgi:CheY-like chemotaxis protein
MSDQLTKPAVLVVDDEALIRLFAVDVLEDAGYLTFEAGDSEEAMDLLSTRPEISVLFTDINMPGPYDGLELARRVHALRKDVQLIITSGRVHPRRTEMPDDGQFVAKPYRAAALLELIRTVA